MTGEQKPEASGKRRAPTKPGTTRNILNKRKRTAKKSGEAEGPFSKLPDAVQAVLNGDDTFYEAILREAVRNLMKVVEPNTHIAFDICRAAEINYGGILKVMGFPQKFHGKKRKTGRTIKGAIGEPSFAEGAKLYYSGAYGTDVDPTDWAIVNELFEKICFTGKQQHTIPTDYANLMRVLDHLGFDEQQKKATGLIYASYRGLSFGNFISQICLSAHVNKVPSILACMVDDPESVARIDNVVGLEGLLARYGILLIPEENFGIPGIDAHFKDTLNSASFNEKSFLGELVGNPSTTDLDITNYEYLGPDLDDILKFLRNAVERGETGINVFLYGPPGEGKTELAKTIAQAVGCQFYLVAEDSDDDKNMPRAQRRMEMLQQANEFLAGRKNVLIGFDEPEDLVADESTEGKHKFLQSKIELNRLIERNRVPTIWMCNDVDKFHTSFRQRFSRSLLVEMPSTLDRVKIWKHNLKKHGIEMPKPEVLDLARKYLAAPRMIHDAIRFAKISKGGRAEIERTLEAGSLLTYEWRDQLIAANRVPSNYDVSLVNIADPSIISDLVTLDDKDIPFALYLQGARGTGGPSLLRYLGEAMHYNCLEYSCLDLKSGTETPEKRIDAIFKSAANSRMFLILRDLHALVEKTNDEKQWVEGSLARAFFKAARVHSMPFAVTVPQNVEIPEVVQQSFSHIIRPQPLDEERASRAYTLFFGRGAPDELSEIQDLTLSDFDMAKGLLDRIIVKENVDGVILQLLEKQREFRGSDKQPVMGFGAIADMPSRAGGRGYPPLRIVAEKPVPPPP